MRSSGVVSIHPIFYIMIALSLFVLPVPLVFGWIIAAAVHEACHLVMIMLLRVKVLSISIGAMGAVIKTEPMSPIRELCCSLAGPIGGLIPLVFMRYVPYIALSAAIQSFYNLLPVYPLDGGRAVKCAATCLAGENAAYKISKIISYLVMILAVTGGTWLSLRYQLGMSPVVFPAVPLICNIMKNSLQRTKKDCTM